MIFSPVHFRNDVFEYFGGRASWLTSSKARSCSCVPINVDTLNGTYFVPHFFRFAYMKVATFDEKIFPSSIAVLGKMFSYKYVSFHVFKFSFLLNVV